METLSQESIGPVTKKMSKVFITGIFIIILVVFGIGAYLLQSGKLMIRKNNVSNPKDGAVVVWKTFSSSSQHPFSFIYPGTAKISDDDYGFLLVDNLETVVSAAPDGNILHPGYFIDMISTSSAKPLRSLVEGRITKAKANGKIINQPLTEIKIGSYPGFTYTLTYKIKSTYVYLQKDATTYGEIIYSLNDKNNKGYQDEIDKIISSFKFIN